MDKIKYQTSRTDSGHGVLAAVWGDRGRAQAWSVASRLSPGRGSGSWPVWHSPPPPELRSHLSLPAPPASPRGAEPSALNPRRSLTSFLGRGKDPRNLAWGLLVLPKLYNIMS